jgi:anti-anti-sigma factor
VTLKRGRFRRKNTHGRSKEPERVLTLERQIGTGTCVARLSGDIDAVTVPSVREGIETVISEGFHTIVLDLTHVDYLDSSALGLLVWADHQLQPFSGALLLAGAGRDVARILELSGLIGVAPSVFVSESVEAALSGLTPPSAKGEPLWARSFEVPGDARLMSDARARIAEILAPLGLSDSSVFDIKVAVGEALANAIRHGSPQGPLDVIGVEVTAFEDRVEITVSDNGSGFDGRAVSSTDVFAPSGRGVLFMRALMDAVDFASGADGGTRVRLAKRRILPAESVT